jgi:hypothetical protein
MALSELWILKDMEEAVVAEFKVIVPGVTWRDWEKPQLG